MLRILWLTLIAWGILAQFFLFALAITLWYVFRYSGYELIFLAILIDGYYGAFFSIPVLSISTLVLVVSINVIKPSLLMYTEKNEMVS